MRKTGLGIGAVMAVLAAAAAGAQSTDRGRSPDTRPPESGASKAPQPATITGCVVRDAANGGQPTVSSNGIAYQLAGRRATELDTYLGKRVEVKGTVETGTPRATSGKTEASTEPPADQTATAGQSDVPATDAPRDNTAPRAETNRSEEVPLATQKGTTADLTGRVQVKSIRIVAGSCL